jgi:predicted NAD/FAD-dependent oxidoreductase
LISSIFSLLDSSNKFIAIGDYLCAKDQGFARIEGATLSGVAAANALASI